ncbi:aspartyl-phosphate phosphatase Spo0E family protein [Neobacillus niacini]|uniref:aspartyl-phosphate phosphatase Spo0E family protein n=1 Tax=Neobacillus niacini TaxID=86668 RepID=UPI0030001186
MTPIKLCPYELKDQIEILTEEMETIGLSEGLCSEQTIMISQKLDNYIAIYLSLKNQANEMCYLR